MSDLRALFEMPLFATLSPEQRQWLAGNVSEFELAKGDVLLHEGQHPAGHYVLVEGELLTWKRVGSQQVFDDRRPAPVSIAEASLLAGIPVPLTFTAGSHCRVVLLPEATFRTLLMDCEPFSKMIFRSMFARINAYDTFILAREKLAALGTLAAGLAHELNNPAAAVARAAHHARETVGTLGETVRIFMDSAVPADVMGELDAWVARRVSTAGTATQEPLRQNEAEDRLGDWLSERGIARPWLVAPCLAAAGIAPDDLAALAGRLSPVQFSAAIRWLAVTLELGFLADEAWRGAGRISEIVKAMKAYSYMDQAPLQEVDIHEGIEDTLMIMRYKLKHGITVTRDYDRTLPRLAVYGSELNQVWTNIVDNAADAMEGRGDLTIRTCRDGDSVVVEITDSGPGIPLEIRPRLFEPFFTTKPLGKGSGLGLDIAYRIIVNRHNGAINVESQPGETTFRVRLPLVLQGAAGVPL
ncbi:ATP-binding protein [Paraburkholderia sp. BL10I2N1]|uniref:ATP-binding protein n=1 Tax=Paraburkholderia sp. BL10I2N1 TaxID=1938796 RepID=UPI0010617C81|nr:ATP-binding protein [Paraburkholderia sp. BL10I2N1]TDN61889.1 nitrogen-specific signal transduction histidine kinase [Paraburkholderia sp. BL10I2N1]